jgi:hypothetical protein
MKTTFSTDWTREEFRAYLLLYAANANFFESEDEREALLKLVRPEVYKKMHKELDRDNDYQSIEKILFTIEKYEYSDEVLSGFMREIEHILNSDNHHDLLEDQLLIGLRKLMKRTD